MLQDWSMEENLVTNAAPGTPGFTELGKRIEMLRVDRRLSKQALAKRAGTSRQQLWRVMTGKSELTLPLRVRLAEVLQVSTLELLPPSMWATPATSAMPSSTTSLGVAAASAAGSAAPPHAADIRAYVADPAAVSRTLASIPNDEGGRRLKRRILDAIEDAALEAGHPLDAAVFDLRRRVLAGEL
jgi:transcriptional regulator with XRE-family HTH domain